MTNKELQDKLKEFPDKAMVIFYEPIVMNMAVEIDAIDLFFDDTIRLAHYTMEEREKEKNG